MTALHYIYISKTVNDQHAKDSRWQKFPDILDERRCLFIFTEYEKRKKACGHSAENA